LFFPLENVKEMPQSAQNTMPENKTHFLNNIISDNTDVHDNAERLQVSNTDNIEPIIKSLKISSTVNVVKQDDSPTKNIPQETIVNNDHKYITEIPKTQIVPPPTVSEISDQFSIETPIINLTQDDKQVIEPIEVESNMDSNAITESSEEEDDDNVEEMLNDFIDSD